MESLKFCRDGVLLRQTRAWDPDESKHRGRPVPLIGWQEAVDPHAFLKGLHSAISFEPGLTVLEFFENLAPWAEQMIGVACMDFPAFLAEARRAPSGDDMSDLSHIELFWRGEISPVPAFTRPKERFSKDENGLNIFHVGRPKKTGRIGLSSRWDMSVRLTEKGRENYGGSESVSLSFQPISDWAHLEIRILEEGRLYDETVLPSSRAYMGTKIPLTNPQHPLVLAGEHPDRGPLSIACDSPAPTFFDTVVRGMLWEIGFDYSPAQRNRSADKLRESLAEARAMLDGEAPAPSPANSYEMIRREEFLADMRRIEEAEAAAVRMGCCVPRV